MVSDPILLAKVIEEFKSWYLSASTRGLEVDESITRAAERLVAAGIPLWRTSTTIPTAHPEVHGVEACWIRGEGCRLTPMPHSVLRSDGFRASPVYAVTRSGEPLRVRLEVPTGELSFPLLVELKERGATDYAIAPLISSNGYVGAFTVASDRPGGFRDDEVDALLSLVPVLSVRLELRATEHALSSLLELYLGRNAGRRVRAGGFRRGTGELIKAAVWYSDMRGFTALGDRLPPKALVKLLDEYFMRVAVPIESHGGEILKFIGDGVLAIFPIAGDDSREPCRRALAAAADAFIALASLNDERRARGEQPLDTGLALHLGEVVYGNIGGQDRLDFTVIGRAVNEASRVESLCKELQQAVLMTAPFARAVDDPRVVSLGSHPLRGVTAQHEIFTLQSTMG